MADAPSEGPAEPTDLELLRDRVAAEVIRPIEERIESAPHSIARMLTYLLEHLYDSRRLAQLERGLGASQRSHQQFEVLLGESFGTVWEKARVEIARKVLGQSGATVVEVAQVLHLRSAQITHLFRKYYDTTPTEYLAAGAPELEPRIRSRARGENEPPAAPSRSAEVPSTWEHLLGLPPQDARDLIFTLLDRYLPGEGEP